VTSIDPSEFASVDPARFAELVKGASRDQLAELMAGPDRSKILDEVFRRFPNQFRADRAGTTNAVIHWHIGGRADGVDDHFEVLVTDGTCTISGTPDAEPNLTITVAGAEFLQLLSGSANPMMLFMTGKLKAKGDLALAANLGNLFDLPKG
jgi:putative sterol carrier protein